MTDPLPGASTSARLMPTSEPVEFKDDGAFRHDGAWNSFQFDPPLTHIDCLELVSHVEELGYRMLFRRTDYSLEEIQERLVEEGPGSFLNMTWLQEDISPKEPPKTAEQRMSDRMTKLAPANDLIITDPYLFTSYRKRDSHDYAASVVGIIAPALAKGLRITAIVSPSQNDDTVRTAVLDQLQARGQDLEIPWWNRMTSTTGSGSRIAQGVSSSGPHSTRSAVESSSSTSSASRTWLQCSPRSMRSLAGSNS